MLRGFRVVIGLTALGLGLTACGGGTSSSAPPASSAATTTTASTSTSGSGASTTTSGATGSSSPTAGLAVESSPYGQVLADAKGNTLYALSADTATKSTCTARCATIWPPFTVTAVPSLGAGVKQSLAGQAARPDGSHQLSYGGHPLYTFKLDKAPHQTKGEGIHSFGGIWGVVAASTGAPVSKAGPSSPAAPSSSASTTSGGGY